ncbi:MAG: aconitase/3-isopropylmalate dehydratase large subunit family protein [Bacteroidales bacterium]|jgi:homoaconitate hydratase family protein/3-isopropylmalate dehydratase small subunit|nr:aconitase/3-isopropylmalate dehydratase large subunit family protein [Bacteroidales bacterium]
MAMTLLEKIIASHSKSSSVHPGEIIDIEIDIRVARDFGGANVVKNIRDHGLSINNPSKTLFTFDCNPTGSDQKYAVNQHICRIFARENGIRVYDIDAGIGTHILIDQGYVYPGATAVSTDSHANILGAIGAFGQGMGDMDIAAAWHNGKIWFKVPPSVRIDLKGDLPPKVSSKDFILNLLKVFGANSLLGFSVELFGTCIDKMSIDDRITVSSMGTEMGAIIILFPPSEAIMDFCRQRSKTKFTPVFADEDASYERRIEIDVSEFVPMVSRPGEPHDTVDIATVQGQKIDSAFIGSCTNGRMSDMIKAAVLLKDKKVAPGVILKIVPATDEIWKRCLDEGLLDTFKRAGALVSNAGCAGCAAGQVGQNGQGEITISTGNRNFPGKQGKGNVYLASPEVVTASAIAGHITTPEKLPALPSVFDTPIKNMDTAKPASKPKTGISKPLVIEGRIWFIPKDNIDTDMIFHNRYLAITDLKEMGQYTFDNLKGFENLAGNVSPGDIVVAGKNFGSGSSRQQAVDCFISLGIQVIIAESFGSIYERNAINAALPIISCKSINDLELISGDTIKINLLTGEIINLRNKKTTAGEPFSEVQSEIYQKGSLLG